MSKTEIIVNSNVTKPLEESAREEIAKVTSKYYEILCDVHSEEKLQGINLDRISDFLGVEIDRSRLFLVPNSKKQILRTEGIDGADTSDGFYAAGVDCVVVYYSEDELVESIESRIVHEEFHRAGLSNIVISAKKSSDNTYRLNSTLKRVGLAIYNEENTKDGNPAPGLLLEEMMASYAGWAYLQQYATMDYWNRAAEVLARDNSSSTLERLGTHYVLLNSHQRNMDSVSILANLFSMIVVRLGIDRAPSYADIVKEAVGYRKDAESIRLFIRDLEKSLGPGSYKALRSIDVSANSGINVGKILDVIFSHN
jgi:hypothetical protein